MARPYFGNQLPIAFAHRGGAHAWPENTLFAFQKAIELGYRYIETDVHLTADGHVVLFHDDTLGRTTNGSGPLRNLTFAELKKLDAGFRFGPDRGCPYRGQGIAIPTLEEALALGESVRLNLEIKPNDLRVVNAIWERIEAHGVHDRVLVASARDSMVQAFRRLARGKVATSAGEREAFLFWAAARTRASRWMAPTFDALQVPPTYKKLRVIDTHFVEAAHHHGLQVHVWTINTEAEVERLLQHGVDAIMTDDPPLLMKAFHSFSSGQESQAVF